MWKWLVAFYNKRKLGIGKGLYRYNHYTKSYIVTRGEGMSFYIVWSDGKSFYSIGDVIHMTYREVYRVDGFAARHL